MIRRSDTGWSLALCVAGTFVLTLVQQVNASPLDRNKSLWQPEKGSREEWLRCHGLSCDEWSRIKMKMAMLKMMATPVSSLPRVPSDEVSRELFEDTLDGCELLTEEQVDEMTSQYKPQAPPMTDLGGGKHRQKRKFIDSSFALWSLPVPWKFDGDHSERERETIRGGFQHWSEHTCVRFRELGVTEPYSDNHILITRQSPGCFSYVGRINRIPQQLNLQAGCVSVFGTIVHEIGHALGLWHEQQRADRDDHIRVNYDNLGYYTGQFVKHRTLSLGVPYDTGSVMHYDQYAGSSNGRPVMETIDPTLQSSMGQRTGLSFADAKIINTAYCQGVCSSPLPQVCQNGGYQDPLSCDRCRCPDGLSGTYCQDAAPSKSNCGGELHVTSSDSSPTVISSAGYDTARVYQNKDECNWKITAPVGEAVRLQFIDQFGVYCHYSQQCYHWVEVKHSAYHFNEGAQGSRFCCYSTPTVVLDSEGPLMVVTLRANWTARYDSSRRGFKAIVSAVPDSSPTTTSTTMTTTTTTTTTTPPTTPTTTMKTTTTTTTPRPTTTPTTTRRTTPSTTTRTTPGPQDCDKMDVVFVLDSSGSVTATNWKVVLTYLQRAVDALPLGPDQVRVGVVSFGNEATPHILLTDFSQSTPLKEAIADIPFKNQWTNTSGGILVARQLFEASPRSDAMKSMVIVTDGPSNRNRSRTIPEAVASRAAGIEVYVVAVGGGVDVGEVNAVAGSTSHVMIVPDYADFHTEERVSALLTLICPETTTPGGSELLWSCSFEDDQSPLCGMRQLTDDDFDWTRKSGRTPSSKTGPNAASDGSYYIYIEASNPRQPNDKARIELPAVHSAGMHCLSFDYHMYGHHIYKLTVEKTPPPPPSSSVVFKQLGEQGTQWMHADVEVTMATGDKLVVAGERGGEFSGDIAIDNLVLRSGLCGQ